MPTCSSCDGFVTHDFARVFGDNKDTVAACYRCASIGEYTGIDRGESAHLQLSKPR